jgi:uncharacterized membrane protein YhaH (DUF805 family)
MNFQQSIKKCLNNYANFKGRATRSELWFFILFTILVGFVATIFDFIIGAAESSPLNTIVTLAFIIPQLSAGSRRLHDIGKSGWWQLLYLTLIGSIVVFIFFVLETNKRKNQFGPVPKK